jgi:O-antigen/teichoic acid export membrane protein
MQGTMIKRIAKMLAAQGTGMGLNLIVQLLLPPAFLHYYGIRRYGEWLVLSATVSYLSTLNFGVTTYASNQLTMLRKRGEMGEYRRLQGSTLAIILCMIGVGLILISNIFFLPLTTLLHLSTMSRTEATMTAFFLGLLAMSNIFGGYYNNLFMVMEKAHRGLTWSMARWGISTLICIPLAMLRAPVSVIAIGQFSASMVIALLTVWDLKRQMGPLPLGLKGANWKTAKSSLAPSGMFAMIFTQQFLLFQAPVIMLNWLLGPEVVVLFTISRTVFSTARQMLQTITYAIAPEVTFSFANRDMKKLLNIFHYSEKVVFSVIPIANLGAFLASPILLAVWLHKPLLFDPYVYGLMALISGAMSMRDHKQFFQLSTNTHKRLSIIVFFGNILMIAASIPFTIKFGIYGFMFTWLVSEVLQMVLIYHENKRLFRNDPSINFLPIVKLWLVLGVSLPICMGLVHFGQRRSLAMVGVAAVVGILMLIVESYFVFGLKDVWTLLQSKLQHNHPVTSQGT